MPKGENFIDIYKYSSGRYRLRVYRGNVRHYLGMFPTYEDAILAREMFLTNPPAPPEPEPYTKQWFELQSLKQRQDFTNRYSQ